jgi:hypothetical protein
LHQLSLTLIQRTEQIGFRLDSLSQDVFKKIEAFILKLISIRIDLIFTFKRFLEDIFFKDTSSFYSIREDHNTDAVLDALIPDSHISALICPLHDSIPMALIFQVISLISVATFPLEHAPTMLLVILIETLIRVALRVTKFISLLFLPLAMSMFESIHELACITTSILPLVLTESLRLALGVLADIAISICKEV